MVRLADLRVDEAPERLFLEDELVRHVLVDADLLPRVDVATQRLQYLLHDGDESLDTSISRALDIASG